MPLAFLVLVTTTGPSFALTEQEKAQTPWQPGLMWRDSSLPATFPLVVRAPAGVDLYIELQDEDRGAAVLGAGIEGGEPFRVLAPPGTYALDVLYGPEGEDLRDGDAVARRLLIEPLTFAVSGPDTRQGQIVTLNETEGDALTADVAGQVVCQRVTLRPDAVAPRRMESVVRDDPEPEDILDDLFPTYDLIVREVVCD